MQRHENGSDQVADEETDDGSAEGECEDSHRKAARDDRQQREIRSKPNREKIPRRASDRVGSA
jgi:hypothetical protein